MSRWATSICKGYRLVPSASRSAVGPAYLFACLLLGGSAQGIWQNALLQLAGIGLIGWAAVTPGQERLSRTSRTLLMLAAATILVVALQAIPLPTAVWAHGARASIAHDYLLLGAAPRSLPLSLTPYASIAGLLCLIPPLALFCTIVRLRAYRPAWLAGALLGGTVLGVLLGALQVTSPGRDSPWYLYAQTNHGLGVGFFANANHMASLLLLAVPFTAATAVVARSRNIQRYSALLMILAGIAMVLLAGLALNGSLAGLSLALPVIGGSGLLFLRKATAARVWLAVGVALSMFASLAALASSSIGGTRIAQDASSSVQSRGEIFRTTGHAIADFMPFGSGLGSFVNVYRLYESPDTVTNEYVVHAHNDYAELALELGVPGILLMVLFLATWLVAARAVWRRESWNPFAQAASIASAAVLVHSMVDFPLRTAAISASFAMCMALLAERRTPVRLDANDLRPTRHLVIG